MSRSNVSSWLIETGGSETGWTRRRVDSARAVSKLEPDLAGEERREQVVGERRQRADRLDPRGPQPLLGARADARQLADVERREELGLTAQRNDGDPAGLAPVARDLRDDLAARDPERARQVRRASHGGLDRLGESPGREEVGRLVAQVEVALVDPGLLDDRRDLADRRPDAPRELAVAVVARTDEHRARAAAPRLRAAHRGVDAEAARDVVRGRDDPAALRVAADDERLRAQARVVEFLDGGEEGIQVDVRDDHCGRQVSHSAQT